MYQDRGCIDMSKVPNSYTLSCIKTVRNSGTKMLHNQNKEIQQGF